MSAASEKLAFVDKGKKISACYKIPLLNVIFDLLFDDPPSISQCNDCMTTLALMSGLIVGVSQAVLNAVSLEDAIDFKTVMPKEYGEFVTQAALGFNGVFAGVLVCVVYFLAVSCASFHKDALSEAAATVAWWKYTRWVIVLAILLIIIGATGTVIAAGKLFAYQHSHPVRLSEGEIDSKDGFAAQLFSMGCYVGLAAFGTLGPLLMLSGGLRAAKVAAERVHSSYTEFTPDAPQIYEQLDAYAKACPDGSFVHMCKDTFVERIIESVGNGKPGVLAPMSQRLADAIFEHYVEDKIKRCLRSSAAGGPVSC